MSTDELVTCPDCGTRSPRGTVLCRCGYPLEFDEPPAPEAEVRSVTRAPGERAGRDVVDTAEIPVVAPRIPPGTPAGSGPAPVTPSGGQPTVPLPAVGVPTAASPVPGACPACGEPGTPDRTWCARCGARLRPAPEPAPVPAAAPPPAPRRGGPLVLAAVLGVVVLAAVVAAVVLLGRRDATPDAQAPPPPATATAGPTADAAPTVEELAPERTTVQATSVQDEEGGDYRPELTLDGRLDTAWNHDGETPAPGVRVTWTFDAPVHVVGVRLVNGYVKTNAAGLDLFAANQRVADARLIGDGGEVAVHLQDVRDWQEVAADLGTTSQVVLEIVSTYPGERFEDVALSEVRFLVAP